MVSLFIGIPVFKISLESLLTKGDSDVQYIKAKSSALWIKLAMFLLQLSSTHWREEVIAGWAIIPKHPDSACYPCTSHCCFPILSVMKTNWCDYYFVQDLKPINKTLLSCFLSISALISYFHSPRSLPIFRDWSMPNIIYTFLFPYSPDLRAYSWENQQYMQTVMAKDLQKHPSTVSECSAISEPSAISSFPSTSLLFRMWMSFCLFFRLRVLQNWFLPLAGNVSAQGHKVLKINSSFVRPEWVSSAMTSNKN